MVRCALSIWFVFSGFIGPQAARAHSVDGHGGDFYAGAIHPLTSGEYILPLLALALLASQNDRKNGFVAVALFSAALAIGIFAGAYMAESAAVVTASLLLLIVLGSLLVVADRLSSAVLGSLAAVTGLVLGVHSGQDWAVSTSGLQLVIGSAVSAIIIMMVITTWIPPSLDRAGVIVRGIFGGAFALAGAFLLVTGRSGGEPAAGRSIGLPTEESLRALVAAPELSLPVVVGACLIAMVWGAAHGLTPGHGKAIVGAYLVGARGTAWHAVYLGVTVTITHTLGVFLLGLVATLAATQIAPEKLYPWMGLGSGLIVLFLGGSMFAGRMRRLTSKKGHHLHDHDHHHHDHDHHHDHNHHHDHDHHHHHDHDHHHHHDHGPDGHTHSHEREDAEAQSHSREESPTTEAHAHDPTFHYHGGVGHSHLPPGADGAPVTMRSLLALGISGGLLPCPSALVLLLAAIALHRTGFGLILVTSFSVGLAAVLTAVGLLFIKGSRLLDRVPAFSTASRWLPALSALAIGVLGITITWGSIAQLTSG